MSEERKPRVWPLVAALLIGLPVLYFASFAPACWLWKREWISLEAFCILARPIARCNRNPFCPRALRIGIYWLGNVGGVSDIELFFMLQ